MEGQLTAKVRRWLRRLAGGYVPPRRGAVNAAERDLVLARLPIPVPDGMRAALRLETDG